MRNLGDNSDSPKARNVTELCLYVATVHGDCVHLIQYVPKDIEWRWHVRGGHEAYDQVDDQQKEVGEWNTILVESQSQKDQLRESNDLAHLREAKKILLS